MPGLSRRGLTRRARSGGYNRQRAGARAGERPVGPLFAQQRKTTGGIQEPVLTQGMWPSLMLRYLSRLFADGLVEERSPSPG